jgi:hypothetical protein
MIDWNQIQILLTSQSVTADSQQLVRNFLNFHSFGKRQQLMGIFLNFPEKISLFVELLKKKGELAMNPNDQKLSREIMKMEDSETQSIINRKTT